MISWKVIIGALIMAVILVMSASYVAKSLFGTTDVFGKIIKNDSLVSEIGVYRFPIKDQLPGYALLYVQFNAASGKVIEKRHFVRDGNQDIYKIIELNFIVDGKPIGTVKEATIRFKVSKEWLTGKDPTKIVLVHKGVRLGTRLEGSETNYYIYESFVENSEFGRFDIKYIG